MNLVDRYKAEQEKRYYNAAYKYAHRKLHLGEPYTIKQITQLYDIDATMFRHYYLNDYPFRLQEEKRKIALRRIEAQ